MPWPQCRRKTQSCWTTGFPAWLVSNPCRQERPTRIRSAARFARVFEFNAKTTRKFLGMAGGKIWDISAAGAGVSLATGFASESGIVRSSMMHPAARAWDW